MVEGASVPVSPDHWGHGANIGVRPNPIILSVPVIGGNAMFGCIPDGLLWWQPVEQQRISGELRTENSVSAGDLRPSRDEVV